MDMRGLFMRLGLFGMVFALSSCAVAPVDWSGPGVPAGGTPYIEVPAGYRSYWGSPGRSGYFHPYHGRSCYRVASCHRCGHYPCRCNRHHSSYYHNHRHHGDDEQDHGKCKYRIISGDLDGKKKPKSFHTIDWFHKRGYDLDKLKIETETGEVIDGRSKSKKKSKKK